MGKRLLTWPRVAFVLLFAYINAIVSARVAYYDSLPSVLHYLVGAGVALVVLSVGIGVGRAFVSQHNGAYSGKLGEVLTIAVAVLLELGLTSWNVVMHLGG